MPVDAAKIGAEPKGRRLVTNKDLLPLSDSICTKWSLRFPQPFRGKLEC